MERKLELIIKKKLEDEIIKIKKKKKDLEINNKIKELLLLKNKYIILLYEKKLELYKTTLQKYMEIHPFSEESPITITNIFELETKKNLINIAITTDINEIYFCEIKNKSYNIVKKIEGNILCKLNSNKIIKFFHINSNNHTFSIYKKGNNSKYDKIKVYEITFKSYFENYKKGSDKYDDPFSIIDNIRRNFHDYFDVDISKLQMRRNQADIKIIKLIKLTENRIIIITKEKNKQTWGYSGNEKVDFYDFDCKYVVYSIILFDIKTGEKSILYTRDIFFKYLEPYIYYLKTFIHSFDVNLINDNYIYFNICFHKEDINYNIKEFKNEFVICDINKKSFVKHDLVFKGFNELIMANFNNIISYKNRTNFYLIFGLDLYEFKVTKNGIEKSLIYNFNENNNNNNIVKHFIFQDNTFYILTNNYLYIFKLKN